ncbi:hypothetical protein SSPS47_25240 [Streptomyces sp. S4.7]|uniref:hypothetical protein n=1 Tax=Streptomyces sp. S4.7 TaxID=2705439 RepID=UPI001398994D|nr:hypothetical protein [Streptomyces sp. S4.7]QHY98417.1 hypothetical protein SSPS47_25240 [Streptomyces sp. S4.7]
MPATLVAPHVASAESVAPVIAVQRLTNLERAVALYASGMPTGYRWSNADIATVIDWITEGVARLSYMDVCRLAQDARHYRLLWLANQATAEQTIRHNLSFPDTTRFKRAEEIAATLTHWLSADIPQSGWVGDGSHQVYRAYGDDIDEVGV